MQVQKARPYCKKLSIYEKGAFCKKLSIYKRPGGGVILHDREAG
jgi:hypothetical protein